MALRHGVFLSKYTTKNQRSVRRHEAAWGLSYIPTSELFTKALGHVASLGSALGSEQKMEKTEIHAQCWGLAAAAA